MPPRPHHARAAVASHASAVAAAAAAVMAAGGLEIWAGMLAFTGPLLVLVCAGRRDEFVRRHALAALRFNLSVAVYLALIAGGLRLSAGGSAYTVQIVPFLLFLNMILVFNWLAFTAVAMQRAATGQLFTYPFTLPAFRIPLPTPERRA